MDKQPIFSDHDVLITLNAKVDQMSLDIKDVRDGLLQRVSKLEARMDGEDLYHAGIDLVRFKRLAESYEHFQSNLKFLAAIGGAAITLLAAVLGVFIQRWFRL